MSSRSVFRSLQEVFPQVDLRILKAVAIEHSTDVDAAVEFILSDVLPFLNAPQEESAQVENLKSPEGEQSNLVISSLPGNEKADSFIHSYSGLSVEKFPESDYTRAALCGSSLQLEEATCDGSSVRFVGESEHNVIPLEHEEMLNVAVESKSSETLPLQCENVFVNDTTHGSCSLPSLGESVVNGPPSVIEDGSNSVQLCIHGEVEQSVLENAHPKANAGFSSPPRFVQCEDSVVDWSSPLLADTQSLFGLDVPSAVCKTSLNLSELSLEENLGSIQPGPEAEKALMIFFNEYGEKPFCEVDTSMEMLAFDGENTIDDEDPATSISTRSGQTVSIDFLEEFVTDCKGIKGTLVSAMESMVVMMKEVELREKEASLAKEAASKAGLDILEKVEDLKEMLKKAKEANNMHAGEVHGEKSILATEARELQSRLLSLSDQRDKSLAIIEEIQKTLKSRLLAAEEERAKAEQEKLEKEETARKALAEQEAIMDRVVQESKELQKEAEENSKLREFLMDRGSLIDTLQGEICVICEDVLALKERVDGRMPLGRSLSSSQVSSSLASSTSSRMSTLSDRLPSAESSTNAERESQDIMKTQHLECSPKSGEKSVISGAERQAISDDDWEYFDGESELCR